MIKSQSLVKLSTLCLASLLLWGCSPKAEEKASGGSVVSKTSTNSTSKPIEAANPNAKPTAGKEAEEVKAMLAKIDGIEKLAELSPFLTDESAAGFGFVMLIPLSLVVAFQDMGTEMANGLSKAFGKENSPPPAPTKKSPISKEELEAMLAKYDMKDNKNADVAKIIEKFKGKGRAFLTDVATLFDKMGDDKTGFKKQAKDKIGGKIEDMTFEVLAPDRVKITNTKAKKDEKPIEARFEEGAWRLHLFSLDDLQKGFEKGSTPFGMDMHAQPK